MEGLNAGELFADAGILDRLAGDMTHRQGGAAARVAVEFGKDHTGQRQRFAERFRRIDRVLAEHRVDDKQRFNRVDRRVQLGDFLHHRFVDRQATGRVDQQHVVIMTLGPVDRIPRDIDRFFAALGREEIDSGLCRDGFQLRNGGWTINVAGDHQHFFLLLFGKELGQLADCRRLAGALQAGHQHDGGRLRREIEPIVRFAHQLREFAMDDADQRLARAQRTEHLLANGFFLDRSDQGLDGRQGDVGLKQGQAHFAQRVGDIGFGQAGFAAQRLHDTRETLGQVVEHLVSGLV